MKIVFALALALTLFAAEPTMPKPKYSADNQLIRPAGYREWIFVGSSLGMGYREGDGGQTPAFHNVYIQPEAYRIYAATGKFPDKTMMVMELVTGGADVSINKRGKFEDRFLGIEMSVKDESRFPEKWAYFNFIGEGGAELAQAKPIAKEACWSCHNAHAEMDNVFVQFYPVLKAARRR
ncbi:MAG: cytochrome P460 family protein [Acidobacteriota bacterium]|nr:cytochrome P460 family protein [Acidobacteriota bacterium]